MIQALLRKIARIPYVQSAMADRADLVVLRERPAPREIFGLSLIVFSYAIGWPAVSALGMLSVYYEEPLLLGIGGPAIYCFSQLVFIAGIYAAGAKYARTLLRWATRMVMEKMMRKSPRISVSASSRITGGNTNFYQ